MGKFTQLFIPYPGYRGTEEQRFWRKVKFLENGCWEWTGSRKYGYGKFSLQAALNTPAVIAQAHRWCYERYVGKIPDGLELDHLCRNRACVRPSHLDPVTGRVNKLRGEGQSAINANRQVCIRGHDNWVPIRGNSRDCATCRALHNQARRNPAIRAYMLRTGQPWAGKKK